MRVSTSMQFQTQMGYIQSGNSKVNHASMQYQTGQKFQSAGESPSGMSSKVRYTADIAAFKQYGINAGVVKGNLTEAETALSSMWDSLSGVQSRLQQAVNGSMNNYSLEALAEDIEQVRDHLFDLMNTKTAEGEFIFAGSVSSQPAFTKTSDGKYICQANGGVRYVQVSPTVTMQATDSGLNIFQNVPLSHKYSNTTYGAAPNTVPKGTQVTSYEDWDDLWNDIHSSATGANNKLNIEIKAGTPAGSNSTFEVKHGTNVIASGTVQDNGKIQFKGVEFDLGSKTPPAGNFDMTMEAPKKDNILNQLNDVINVLRDPKVSQEDRQQILMRAQIDVGNAKDNIDNYRGQIGARAANIE